MSTTETALKQEKAKKALAKLSEALRTEAQNVRKGKRYKDGLAFDGDGKPVCVFGQALWRAGFRPGREVMGNDEALAAYLEEAIGDTNGVVSHAVDILNDDVGEIQHHNDNEQWKELPKVLNATAEAALKVEYEPLVAKVYIPEAELYLLQDFVKKNRKKFGKEFIENLMNATPDTFLSEEE